MDKMRGGSELGLHFCLCIKSVNLILNHPKIPIETHGPVHIGRKRAYCEQIIDDIRVSRLHATITFVNGKFYIKDEGSSGGTFVNRRKLGTVDNWLLNHNDIINFNELEYRFEISNNPTQNASQNGENSHYEYADLISTSIDS
ncbi:FHA domain-containing protein [Chloroflexi bacterium TSY]|nr:FHA domain-containing protein [Chloroflexi bacterium TSY]